MLQQAVNVKQVAAVGKPTEKIPAANQASHIEFPDTADGQPTRDRLGFAGFAGFQLGLQRKSIEG
jgi:hypothetical protein